MSRSGFYILLVMAALQALGGCADGGSGHFPLTAPPKYDLANTWYVTETRDSYACDSTTVVETPVYIIVQASNTLTVTDSTGGTGSYSAHLNNDRLSWSRRYAAAAGTVDADFSGIAKSAACFNGTVNWVWSDGITSCVGSSSLSANTTAASPSC